MKRLVTPFVAAVIGCAAFSGPAAADDRFDHVLRVLTQHQLSQAYHGQRLYRHDDDDDGQRGRGGYRYKVSRDDDDDDDGYRPRGKKRGGRDDNDDDD